MLLLPYIKGFSEILPCLPPTQCQDCFQILPHPSTLLAHIKIQKAPEERKETVNQVPCEYGWNYIGQTGKQLKARIAEHKTAVRKACNNNAIASNVDVDLDQAIRLRVEHFSV